MPVETVVFDKDENITQYAISNSSGNLVVKVIDFGAVITNVFVHDKNGKQRDVVLGFDNLKGYQSKDNPSFGSLVGRFANRIAKGKFSLNGTTYQLAINLEPNTLHGGLKGFDKYKWTLVEKTDNSVTLELISKDGDEGFPSTLKVHITYSVTEDNELKLDYMAEVLDDKDTILNLTNHSYFNLNGCTKEDEITVLNHSVYILPKKILDVDSTLIPTGKILSVEVDNVMDFFTKDHVLSERIPSKIEGYDNAYVLEADETKYNIKGGDKLELAAIVKSPLTGITVSFYTTEPTFQFYSGNVVSDVLSTKTTQTATPIKLAKYAGFCLEAQRIPDAINQEKWKKQVILSKGQKYEQKTVYHFYTRA